MSASPLFTIVIPTYNSARTLEGTLASISAQNIPAESVEVLVVDGGSQDQTREIAMSAGATVLDNPRTQQEYGKHLGLLKARGEFVMFLDSDEVLSHPDGLAQRQRCFEAWPEVGLVLFGGYERPSDAAPINDYINFYSDPFAWFMYRLPTAASLFLPAWRRRFRVMAETADAVQFGFADGQSLPLVDMCAGNTLRRTALRSWDEATLADPTLMPNLFYLIATRTRSVAILKDASTIHHSAESLTTFVRKLRWRVIANVHYRQIPGTGFTNREPFQPATFRSKKYLFIPYALTLLIPLVESIWNACRQRRAILLLHLPLTLLTALLIIQQYCYKIVGRRPSLRTYGRDDRSLNL